MVESGRQEYPKKVHSAAVLENSHSFSEGENIPKKYTSDGVTVSAALRKSNGKVVPMIFPDPKTAAESQVKLEGNSSSATDNKGLRQTLQARLADFDLRPTHLTQNNSAGWPRFLLCLWFILLAVPRRTSQLPLPRIRGT